MEKRNYLVATCLNEDGTTRFVLKVHNCSKEKLDQLVIEQKNYEEKQLKEKNELLNEIHRLNLEIENLKEDIKYLKGE